MTESLASPEAIKDVVRTKYAEVVTGGGSCCGTTNCCGSDAAIDFADDYSTLEGYVPEADYGLGCGLPTEHAGIEPGHTVLDLGSGAGNDAFVARRIVGDTGHVIGVDFTPEMVARATENARKLDLPNVSFRLGDIEDLPVDSETVDVVVSNCVLNLVPDKARAFSEMFRVLKPGGRFCISDIVARGQLPESVRGVAELYAGCVSGAISEHEYLELLRQAGFDAVKVVKAKEVVLSDEALSDHLSPDEIRAYRAGGDGLASVTVVGRR